MALRSGLELYWSAAHVRGTSSTNEVVSGRALSWPRTLVKGAERSAASPRYRILILRATAPLLVAMSCRTAEVTGALRNRHTGETTGYQVIVSYRQEPLRRHDHRGARLPGVVIGNGDPELGGLGAGRRGRDDQCHRNGYGHACLGAAP